MRTLVLICALLVCVNALSTTEMRLRKHRVSGDAGCKGFGGTCKEKGEENCNGVWMTGICSGPSSRQCCAPKKKIGVGSKCGKRAGTCIDVTEQSCEHGKTAIGLCHGPAEVQCCQPPAAPVNPPAPNPNNNNNGGNPPVPSGFPSFDTLWKEYPNGEPEDVKQRIGGGVNADYITNTCVIRVARSMWRSGMAIKSFVLPSPKWPAGTQMATVRGGDGHGYPMRVKEFKEYMLATYGKPHLTASVPGDSMEIPDSFRGKEGIIMFDVRVWDDATGHFDLWNGHECRHQCYFEKAHGVWLWVIG
jgi:hypothetical protein